MYLLLAGNTERNADDRIHDEKDKRQKEELPTRFERVTLGSAIPRSTAELRELFKDISTLFFLIF